MSFRFFAARWPWLTCLVALIVLFSPPGVEVFQLAFLTNEALSRNIWQPVYLAALACLVLLGLLEWGLRLLFIRRSRAMVLKNGAPKNGSQT